MIDEIAGRNLSPLDDLILLAEIVEAGGFTAASKATGVTKARLSRRIADLEQRLGVRVIERTTRSFRVTDIGMRLSEHGLSLSREAEAAKASVAAMCAEPTGSLKVACPLALGEHMVADIAIRFAAENPSVRLSLDLLAFDADMCVANYDVILMPALDRQLADSTTIVRQIMGSSHEIYASPAWIERSGLPSSKEELETLDAIGWWQNEGDREWLLRDPDGAEHAARVTPRFKTNSLVLARRAAIAGLGMARLPTAMCDQDVAAGRLMSVLPGWCAGTATIYAAYPSRRSLTAAGRAFLDMIASELEIFRHQPGPLSTQ